MNMGEKNPMKCPPPGIPGYGITKSCPWAIPFLQFLSQFCYHTYMTPTICLSYFFYLIRYCWQDWATRDSVGISVATFLREVSKPTDTCFCFLTTYYLVPKTLVRNESDDSSSRMAQHSHWRTNCVGHPSIHILMSVTHLSECPYSSINCKTKGHF